jgi:hypothetical protein
MKNKIYAIIPVTKAASILKHDLSHGRYSIDRTKIIWNEEWTEEKLAILQSDPEITLLLYSEALIEMQLPNWTQQEEG